MFTEAATLAIILCNCFIIRDRETEAHQASDGPGSQAKAKPGTAQDCRLAYLGVISSRGVGGFPGTDNAGCRGFTDREGRHHVVQDHTVTR